MEPTRDCKDVACGRQVCEIEQLPNVGHQRMPLMAPFSAAIISKFENKFGISFLAKHCNDVLWLCKEEC